MSLWRHDGQPPQDFVALLYDESDNEAEMAESGEFLLEEDDEEVFDEREGGQSPRASPVPHDLSRMDDQSEPSPPPYSPLTSPERRERSPSVELPCHSAHRLASRDRSRSPHLPSESSSAPAGVVLRVFDEHGMALDDGGDIFFEPDTHALYVSPEERDRDERYESSVSGLRGGRRGGRRSGRRGARSVRGQRARGHGYPNQGRRGNNQWVVGHPLHEIWTSDEDVPPELVSLATDVLRRRQMRTQDAARAERNAERDDASENDDEFFDARNGADDLPRLEGQNLRFEWSPMDSFQGQEHNFVPERTGSVQVYNSAYDAFRSYWDDEVLELIVTETNLYATKIDSAAFQSEWYPTNAHEILCLFSFWMMLGIVKMPTIVSCFSADFTKYTGII